MSQGKRDYNTIDLVMIIRDKFGYEQQDANEFLYFLFERCEDEWKRVCGEIFVKTEGL